MTLSNSPGKVIPGKHFTLFFDLKLAREFPENLQEELILPAKWNLLSQRKPERAPGQTTLRYFFVIGVPSDCPAGDFPVILNIETANTQLAATKIFVTIQEIHKVEVFILSKPEYIKEGDSLKIEYLIQNVGNVKEYITPTTTRGVIMAHGDSLSVEPNEKIKITVSQIIPHTETNAWQVSSDLTIHLKGVENSVFQATSVPVFSSRLKKIDPYFRFPIEAGGGYLSYRYGDRNFVAYQYSLTGKGFVDQKAKHFVDFIIRGPNQFRFPSIGNYDQYTFGYQYKKSTNITVGDHVLQLNNLMEFARFGRGVRIEQQFRKFDYLLFYQKARFYFNQKESFGGRVVFKFNTVANVAINYDSKNIVFRGNEFWSNLVGFSGQIRLKEMSAEAELATGNARGKTDYGAFLRYQLIKKWVGLSGNFIYTGKNFYGFYNNSILANGNANFNITQKLNLGLSANFSNVNPSLDANVYSISPKDKNYMAFMSYQLNLKNRLFVFYSILEREDKQKPSTYHFSENFGNLSYSLSMEKFSLFYQIRYGKARNLLISDTLGKRESFSNIIQPNFRVFSGVWVGGYLEYQHTSKFSKADIVQDLFFYGGNVRVNLGRSLFANFMYRNNYAPDELYVRRSFMDAAVILDLKRHRITFTGGRSFIPNSPVINQNTLFFSLKYAIKLNLALARRKNIGTVRGKLTGSGFSKEGNLIQLGSHKFLTDSTGMFWFEGLAPDRYYLSISQNESKNEGVVPNQKMPMFLDVKADSTKDIEIPLTRTGNIRGKVDFLKPSRNGLSGMLSQKPTVLIKLSHESESFLTELNEKDEFSFKEMKPGNWTLTAIITGSQDRFVIDNDQKQLNIECDKTMDVVFNIRPNEKRIHFSEKSFELSTKK
ncbi:hypothetical protein FDK13_18480 [Dyadobacter frigoris]|uniref:Uncharacterized protein n=1 Tax=Dyadobacter frigoris TaxID=2576211 RepID=A0A4U6D320_9BACT|nr:hypothetical protein FDK13_18480 [Dyadobacter frigoris]